MDDRDLFERQHASLAAFYRLLATGAEGSRLIEHGDVVAAVVPVAPDRSVCNGVVSQSSQALSNALETLAGTYEQAGVRAWTVWVPASDTRSALLLEQAGHRLDATPAAMALELERFDGAIGGVEPYEAPQITDIASINDVAYGYDGDFTRALAGLPAGATHLYVARVDGKPAASTIALDHEGDCLIGLVATLPEARGKGLATALMTQALLDARERGCETSTLQATKMGQPVYERMGYRDLGPLHMWERRQPASMPE